jgi:hypothetical protein
MVKKTHITSRWTDSGAGTTGGAVADLSRDGLSVLTADEVYTLQAPVTGCRKTLVAVSTSTGGAITVLAATSSGNITFDQAGNGKLSFAAGTTTRQVVELMGLNTTSWVIVGSYPVATSGAGPGPTTF